jgi:phage shock protein C
VNVKSEEIRAREQGLAARDCTAPPFAGRRLTRSRDDRMIAGVCGGLAAYLGVDRVMVRFSFVALALAGGLAIPLYVIAWMLVPAAGDARPARAAPLPILDALLVAVGGTLIAVGAAVLPARLAPWSDDRLTWAVALVAIGVVILLRGMRR